MKWLYTGPLMLALSWFVMGLSPAYAANTTLTWTPNTESDLAGYKVYRGNGVCAIGPLQPLVVGGSNVSVLVPLATYTDTTVPTFDGQLCYEITAFDTAGNESPHSVRATKAVNLIPPVAPAALSIGSVVP
jgi:hypothetical protein